MKTQFQSNVDAFIADLNDFIEYCNSCSNAAEQVMTLSSEGKILEKMGVLNKDEA